MHEISNNRIEMLSVILEIFLEDDKIFESLPRCKRCLLSKFCPVISHNSIQLKTINENL